MHPNFKERLNSLNSLYGRGDIASVETASDGTSGTVTQKLQYGTAKRTFRIKGNTLFFCGHQTNMDKELRY